MINAIHDRYYGVYLCKICLNTNVTIVYLKTLFEILTKNHKSKEHLSVIEFQNKHCNGVKN